MPCTFLPISMLFSKIFMLATTEPILFCLRFFYFCPSPPFPTSCQPLLGGFIRFLTSNPPSPIPSSFPSPFLSLPPLPSPLLFSLKSSLPFSPRPYSRPSFHFAFVRSPPPPFPLRRCPLPRPHHHVCVCVSLCSFRLTQSVSTISIDIRCCQCGKWS